MKKLLLIFTLVLLLTLQFTGVSHAYWISAETSAYTSYESSGYTASGDYPYEGGVACNFLPLGTRISINGNDYIVNDRCGIDGVVDIYMNDYNRAIGYGRQVVDIYVYE